MPTSSVMLAERYDAFLFDLDGVLYRGSSPVPFAAEALGRLRASGVGIAFVTNNSSATPEVVADRLDAVGISAEPREVETSALTTASILAARGMTNAFVLGEAGIRRALLDAGIRPMAPGDRSVDAVVVGLDRSVTYEDLRLASALVAQGASFVATNADASFPAADGTDWPGAGALVAAIETTTGATAEVVGKPNAPILRAALVRAGGASPLLVGDRLDTDIAGARALGWDSLLVLTGIAARSDLAASPVAPTYVGEDLRVLFEDDRA